MPQTVGEMSWGAREQGLEGWPGHLLGALSWLLGLSVVILHPWEMKGLLPVQAVYLAQWLMLPAVAHQKP